MDSPSTPSMAGPSRRSRRIAGTTADTPGSIGRKSYGYGGGAISATSSPYARRPNMPRDPSSQTLDDVEAGFSTPTSSNARSMMPASTSKLPTTMTATSRKDAANNRRRSMGPEGLLRSVVKRGLGWLTGRSATDDQKEQQGDEDEEIEELASASRKDDEEQGFGRMRGSMTMNDLSKFTKPQTSSSSSSSRLAGVPLPPPASKRIHATIPSIASGLSTIQNDDEEVSPKKFRTSHSTLDLPSLSSNVQNTQATRYSPSPAPAVNAIRSKSPVRAGPPLRAGLTTSRSSIFAPSPLKLPPASELNGPSHRSVSPGGISQTVLAQPTSATSSVFGLTSQSPFRTRVNSGRSPDLSSLNISSGLARSPSIPRERLQAHQQQQRASRLYPYARRSPSVTSATSRPPGTLPISYSLSGGLAGTKRGFHSMSVSPPKISPVHSSLFRPNSTGVTASPTSTDFGSDAMHRSKRQRLSVVWDPEKGFVTSDADGRSASQALDIGEAPKNEAERILERLESLRRPQVDGMRATSPKRINIPMPAVSTPTADGSIFAKRITASQSVPSLPSVAISPYARRQLAAREEETLLRDRVKASGGLGERMRTAQMEREAKMKSKTRRQQRLEEQELSDTEQEMETVDSAATEQRVDRRSSARRHHDDEDEEVSDLPQPPSRPRTRQRTRELSVLSDASEMDEDQQFSPRRSTRNKGKKAAEPARAETPKQRRPKSAKSPEPLDTQAKKGTSKQTKAKASGVNEDSMDGVETRSGRRLRSPAPASPPAASAKARKTAASPVTQRQAKEAAPSISQVMDKESTASAPSTSTPSSMRPGRTHRSTQREAVVTMPGKRATNTFSARDDDEEDGAELEADSGITKSDTVELAKLKLPASIFANRFSFGKAPGSPSALQAQKRGASPAPAGGDLASRLGGKVDMPPQDRPSPASEPPTLSLPPAASTGTTEQTSVKAAEAPKPMFSFASPKPAAAPSPSEPSPAPSAPVFSFNKPVETSTQPAKTAETSTAGEKDPSSKPLFSFTAPSSNAPATSIASGTSPQPSATPSFSFGAKPAEPEAAKSAAPTFSFGVKANEAEKPSAPSFSFGSSVGTSKPSDAKSPDASIAPAATSSGTPSNPFAAFPASKPSNAAAPATPEPAAAGKPPTFAFGGSDKVATSIASTSAPAFTFGQASSTTPAPLETTSTPKPSVPAFSFKPATPTPATNGSGEAMHDSPPAAPADKPSASAPFSPVLPPAGGSKPAFTFGGASTASAAPSPSVSPSAAPAPAFTFGRSSGNAGVSTTPFGTPPASSAGTTQPFSFGGPASSAAATAPKPAFTFGGGGAATTGASAPAFSFGQSSSSGTGTNGSSAFGTTPSATTNGAPAFGGFGAPSPAAPTPGAANKPAFSFGAAAPGPGSSGTPSFSFGAPSGGGTTTPSAPGSSSGPTFAFGAGASSSAGAGGAPSFTFGAGGPAPTPSVAGGSNPFAFGASSAATSPAAVAGAPSAGFAFGAGTPTQSGATTPGGTMFSIGSGGDANSPNKAKRQIKPLRRGRT